MEVWNCSFMGVIIWQFGYQTFILLHLKKVSKLIYAQGIPLTYLSFLYILRLQQKPQESSEWHACKWLGKLSSSCQSPRISLSYSFILWCPSSGKFSNSSTGFVNSIMVHPLSALEHIQWCALGISKDPLT